MIINSDKLNGCDPRVREVVQELDIVFGNVIVTRGNDDPATAPPNTSTKSQHFLGLAADVIVSDVHPFKIATYILNRYAIRGLGVSVFGRFVHFDFRNRPRLVEWTYDSNGKEVN